MLGASTVRWSSRFHLLWTSLEKIFGNIPSAPSLSQFTCMIPSTFAICIQDKKLM